MVNTIKYQKFHQCFLVARADFQSLQQTKQKNILQISQNAGTEQLEGKMHSGRDNEWEEKGYEDEMEKSYFALIRIYHILAVGTFRMPAKSVSGKFITRG